MSTLAYAAMTRKREEAQPGKSTTSQSPGLQTYVDALAALVPAEVLTAHGAILTFTTKTNVDKAIAITDPGTLFYVFWALIALSMILYIGARLMNNAWDGWDYLRVLIPPLSFVGWTMLQKATAFDGLLMHWQGASTVPLISDSARSASAIIGAIVLGLLASALAYKADQK